MTSKKRETRRAYHQALAVEDTKHRCGLCKRELPRVGVHKLWMDPLLYCSEECVTIALERQAHR